MPTPHLQQEIVALTQELIRIPSTHSRPQEIWNCAFFIEKWLTNNNISYKLQESNGIPTIMVLPEKGRVPVLLMSHFDVVEADDELIFTPRLDGDRLFGRGAIDDKYGVALSLILYREYRRKNKASGSNVQMPFGLLFTGDEEVGGTNGAAVAAKRINTDFFLAIDGGRPDLIVTKEKGIVQLELEARGTAAHAARPWLGQSAFDLLMDDYRKMQHHFSTTTADHWHRTMVLTKCQTGNGSTNIVPDKARAIFDIRYTEEDNPKELINNIRREVTSEVTVHALDPVFMGRPSSYLDLLVAHSDGARVGFEHGASDARYLSQLGIPGAIWGADGEMSQHRHDERIVVPSMLHFYDCLDGFLNTVASG